MKKILLTLLTVVMSVSAWAYTLPTKVMDLSGVTNENIGSWTEASCYSLTADYLVVSANASYRNTSTQSWITQASVGSGNGTWATVTNEPFNGSSYYTTEKYATIQANRNLVYRVKNCKSVKIYGKNNSTSKYLQINIYEVTDGTAAATPAYTLSYTTDAEPHVWSQTLDGTKEYAVDIEGVGSSNSQVYEVAFERNIVPSIIADDVEIEYNATSGEIVYTIANPTTGNPTAVKTTGDWISNVAVDAANSKVTFDATANTSNEPRQGKITISYTGAADKVVNITQKRVPIESIVDVTGAMKWDFTGSPIDVMSEPTEEVILGNYATLTTGDADALKGKQQYIVRSGYCWQGTELTFHPTVAGTVEVEWCSTGSGNKRTLKINENDYANPEGMNATSRGNAETTSAFVLADQDVVLTGWNYDSENDEYTSNQIRIWSITFTPAVTVNACGNGSYSCSKALDFTDVAGVEAYIVTAETAESVTLTKVNKVPANTGIFVIGTAGSYNVPVLDGAADVVSENMLVATTTAKEIDGSENIWALSKNDGLLHPVTSGTIAAGKAYLVSTVDTPSPARAFVFDNESTGIQSVQSTANNGVAYNLAGQRVAANAKGIVIMNGKKYLNK